MKNRYSGIILAGGRSSRMGAEKGLALLCGKPLIHYPLKTMKELCGEILISSNTNAYDYLGYPVIQDIQSGSGPMGGILSCLLRAENQNCLIIGCDMPFITANIYKHLLRVREGAQICVPWHNHEHYEPMCGVYSRDSATEMRRFMEQGNNKLPDFFRITSFKAAPVGVINPPLPEHYFFNVNSPEDLERATQLMDHQKKEK